MANVKYGVEIDTNVIALDDDGDGVYDDVHYSPNLGKNVRSFDNDGDGIYDDISYVISHNPSTSSSTSSVSASNSSARSGYASSGLNITKKSLKKLAKVILILAGCGFVSMIGIYIYLWATL